MALRRLRHGGSKSSAYEHSVEVDMSVVSRDSTAMRTAGSRAKKFTTFSFGAPQPKNMELAIDEASDEDSDVAVEEQSSSSSHALSILMTNRSIIFSVLVGVIGLLASTFFLGFGISAAVREQEGLFGLRAEEAATELESAWKDYEDAGRWLHQACSLQNITHNQFTDIYDYLIYNLEVNLVQWVPQVTDEARPELEGSTKQFLNNNYPDFDYHGISGYETDLESPSGVSVQNRSVQPFYFPIHYYEPLEGNLNLADFDLYSSEIQKEAIDLALETFKPALSKPFFPRELNKTVSEKLIMLLHPGIPLSSHPDLQPRDLGALLVEIKSIIRIIASNLPESLILYLYDTTEYPAEEAGFLVGAEVTVERYGDANITYLDEIGLDELIETTVVFNTDFELSVAQNAKWTLVVVAAPSTFEPNVLFIILIGKFTLCVCLCIALWIYYNMRRTKMLQELKRRNDAEKAAMIVNSARETAKVEQDLNDYIAHEVRNPLAAALSACSFVKSSVNEKYPMRDPSSITSVREDVDIIESSLSFMNDLLRSMLDMHRAASKKIQVQFVPVDIRNDILQPVATMLYGRDMNFEVLIECPDDLEVLTDRLRLKQIVLNLGRNATKFVRKGFVKLGATIVEGNVRLFVADSGFGISKEKKKTLFSKFQESLDVMNQGTGMGLCLCKNMTELLSGDIWLDESYESGIEGYPGTRFIIDLKMPPLTKDVYETFVPVAYENARRSYRQVAISESPPEVEETKADLSLPTEGINAAEVKPLFSSLAMPSTSEGAATAPGRSSAPKVSQAAAPGSKDTTSPDENKSHELPETQTILFVDDDLVLRKLFSRSVRKAVAGWNIKDAANGETALKMVETENFDIIFVDQYMASVEKQLLGTETTRALRSKGVTSRICGLSANDVEQEFLRCGADFFMFKPFPCKPDELRKELHHIIYSKRLNPAYDKPPSTQEHSDSTSQLTQSTVGEEASKEITPPQENID